MTNPNLVRKIVDNPVGGSGEGSLSDIFAPGMVMAFAGTTSPSGWVICNGAAVSRSIYSALFATLGVSHGAGDGVTTFNLPDYRGRFLRGVDGGIARDPDRAARTAMATGGNTGDNVGSVQGHAFQTHTHIQDSHNHSQNAHSHVVYSGFNNNTNGGNYHPPMANNNDYNRSTSSTTATNNPTTATNQNASASGATAQATPNETRPVNAYVNYIIKV